MKPIKDRIEEIKTNGYQLDFADVFNHAFENYKKIALYAGLMIFVFFVILIILFMGIAVSVFGVAELSENLKPENLKAENFSDEFLYIYMASVVLITSLISPFQAGFLKMADNAEKDKPFHVSTIFEYYKAPYFKEIFMATLLISMISLSLSTVLNLSGIQIIGILVSYILSFISIMTIPLIVFGKLKAIEAIKTSIMIVMKQPFVLLALVIVAFIASMVGFIGCCIGVFFTIPFLFSMNYSIYNSIVGIDSENESEKISSDME